MYVYVCMYVVTFEDNCYNKIGLDAGLDGKI